ARARLAREQECGEPRCGLGDEHPVHAVRAGTELAAQPRRAERETRAEPRLELGDRPGVAGLGGRDERVELGAGEIIGVLVAPGAGALEQLGVHSRPTICASSALMTGSASRPAWM